MAECWAGYWTCWQTEALRVIRDYGLALEYLECRINGVDFYYLKIEVKSRVSTLSYTTDFFFMNYMRCVDGWVCILILKTLVLC